MQSKPTGRDGLAATLGATAAAAGANSVALGKSNIFTEQAAKAAQSADPVAELKKIVEAQAEQIKMENAGVAALVGGVPGMEGPPGNPMGGPGLQPPSGPPAGSMDPGIMGWLG